LPPASRRRHSASGPRQLGFEHLIGSESNRGRIERHAPYDHCTAKYLAQAGVANEHIRLETRGIRGNGHGIPSEMNNLVSARLVDDWLQATVR
jgi:hypothetical protein